MRLIGAPEARGTDRGARRNHGWPAAHLRSSDCSHLSTSRGSDSEDMAALGRGTWRAETAERRRCCKAEAPTKLLLVVDLLV